MSGSSLAVADYLSTLSTAALQDIMRRTPTAPLSALLNDQRMRIDYEHRRVWRDSFWKGSFARDTLLGWEERLMTPIRANAPFYTGGRFWKRFDEVRGDEALGLIVNYGLQFLPGLPAVRQVRYPDDKRRYIQSGDDVLLLSYRNHPYRIVYDLIKIVDANHCIGVMHLGTFPNGVEFATFVMARNNYPFEKMAVPDHDAIFADPNLRVPDAAELAGSWKGYLVFLRRPDLALHNQFNPPLLRVHFTTGTGGTMEARMRMGVVSHARMVRFDQDCVRLTGSSSTTEEIRRIDAGTLIGRTIRNAAARVPTRRYVLVRA
jgi:hypothetical protein